MKKLIIFVILASTFSLSVFAQSARSGEDSLGKKTLPDFLQAPYDGPAAGKNFWQTDLDSPRGFERVEFIGDSITFLWNLEQYFPRQPYINKGIGGDTTVGILARFQTDVINVRPRVLIVLAGTNDIAGFSGPMTVAQSAANMAAITTRARANRIEVILASVLPVNDYCVDAEGHPFINSVLRPPAKIRELNGLIRAYAEQNRVIYLDYYSAMVDENGFLRAGIANDGLHPNALGYQIMRPLAAAAIKAALKKTSSFARTAH